MKVTETSLLLALSQWLVVETALLSSSAAGLFSGNAEEEKSHHFISGGGLNWVATRVGSTVRCGAVQYLGWQCEG